MDLFIQLRDGHPFEHPILSENFHQAFPDVNTENLPAEFARFVRVVAPTIGVYDVYEGVKYERSGDVFTDVHYVRPMTDAEKAQKQSDTQAQWAATGHASWIFNPDTCEFEPPVPYPNDGKTYRWDEPSVSWEEVAS